MLSLDDALELAGQVLADYETSGARDESGLALDQLAQVLRELAGVASAWRAERERDRSAVTMTGPRPSGSGDRGAGRVRGWLARMRGAGSGRAPAERGAVVLAAEDAATVWQALADAGAWHGAYGDCAACVAAGLCADGPRSSGERDAGGRRRRQGVGAVGQRRAQRAAGRPAVRVAARAAPPGRAAAAGPGTGGGR